MRKLMYSVMTLAMAFLLISFTFTISVNAADSKQASYTFPSGKKANYHHYMYYPDMRCGMSTKVYYHGWTSKGVKLKEIGVSWKIYSINGSEFGDGGKTLYNNSSVIDSTRIDAIDKSYAKFTFKDSSGSWSPGGYIYHCLDWSVASSEDSKIPEIYKNIHLKPKSVQSSIFNDLFSNYTEELSNFVKSNGNPVSINDFKIVKGYTQKGSKISDSFTGVTFDNNSKTDFSVVNLEMPSLTKKNNEWYKLKAYIIVNNGEIEDRVDFGLITEKVK